MHGRSLHVQDSHRPVIQLVARPDLHGNWSIELQAAFLDSRVLKKTGTAAGTTAAGLIAGFLELLQELHEAGNPDVPTASLTLWTVATTEAIQ
jgi:hypothetical protein